MPYDQFIGQVQQRARLASKIEAETATRATLETLAERLLAGAPDISPLQLAPEITQLLGERTPKVGERFDRDEFFLRVNAREGIANLPKSMHHALTVLAVLSEAMPPGEVEKIMCALPEEFERLFEPNGAAKAMRYGADHHLWREGSPLELEVAGAMAEGAQPG